MDNYRLPRAVAPDRVAEVRAWIGRLRYFSFAVARPKEGEGDSLQLEFVVGSLAEQRELFGRLRYTGGRRVEVADIALDVVVSANGVWLRTMGAEGDIYAVTEADVRNAEAVEAAFDARGLATWPRRTSMLGWLTADLYPELF